MICKPTDFLVILFLKFSSSSSLTVASITRLPAKAIKVPGSEIARSLKDANEQNNFSG